MAALKLFQWLHILSGALWVGGFVITQFVIWPALLRIPVHHAKPLQASLEKSAAPLFALAAVSTILLGILRGTWLGPLKSWSSLSSSYGHAWLAGLVFAIGFIVFGATVLRRMPQLVWVGNDLHPKAVARVRMSGMVGMAAFSLILASMVRMHFGA